MRKRILKTLASLFASQGLYVLTQLLLPPAFIRAYGVAGYGEWLVLAASVNYLSTLDFGLQTYVLNELTMLYHRGQMEDFQRVQSVGLALAMAGTGLGVILLAPIFVLPLRHWLGIGPSQSHVELALFILALQIMAGLIYGQCNGLFRVVGQAHRGYMWLNVHGVLTLAATLGLTAAQCSFWTIAAGQLAVVLLSIGAGLADLKRRVPAVFPRLNYWNLAMAKTMLKSGSYFLLFPLGYFLLFQAPIVLFNRLLGPQAVVAFSMGRTIFSFSRQAMGMVQSSIAPEITRLFGLEDWIRLRRLYAMSESFVLTWVVVLNAGLFVFSPAILHFWTKKSELFDPTLYLSIMLATICMCVKDYKFYFQLVTNRHITASKVILASYSCVFLLAVPAVSLFGLPGFAGLWLLAETVQIAFLHRSNQALLSAASSISRAPLLKVTLLAAGVACLISANSWWVAPPARWSQYLSGALAMGSIALVSAVLFRLDKVIAALRVRS